MSEQTVRFTHAVEVAPRPRVGFVGVGWIGRHRLKLLGASNLIEVAAVADTCAECLDEVRMALGEVAVCECYEQLLELPLDAVVIATPSALHAVETIDALRAGMAVFCQKPLSRTAQETVEVIYAARKADKLVGVDLPYRHMTGSQLMRKIVLEGGIGDIYSIEGVFHNAYGPEKSWFYNPALAGGGCVIDLGIHLLDMVQWLTDFAPISDIRSRLFCAGRPLHDPLQQVEDYASVQFQLAQHTEVSLACSWNHPAAQEAVIEMTLFGTQGALSLKNVNGSFYNFVTERYWGTHRETLQVSPEQWGGRAALRWANQLSRSTSYDSELEQTAQLAAAIDSIYALAV